MHIDISQYHHNTITLHSIYNQYLQHHIGSTFLHITQLEEIKKKNKNTKPIFNNLQTEKLQNFICITQLYHNFTQQNQSFYLQSSSKIIKKKTSNQKPIFNNLQTEKLQHFIYITHDFTQQNQSFYLQSSSKIIKKNIKPKTNLQ